MKTSSNDEIGKAVRGMASVTHSLRFQWPRFCPVSMSIYATSTPHCCDRPSVGLKNKPFIPSQSETERGPERLRSINKQGS